MNNFTIVVAPKTDPECYAIYSVSSLKTKDQFYQDWEKAKEYALIGGDEEEFYDSLICFMKHNGYNMEMLNWDYATY